MRHEDTQNTNEIANECICIYAREMQQTLRKIAVSIVARWSNQNTEDQITSDSNTIFVV